MLQPNTTEEAESNQRKIISSKKNLFRFLEMGKYFDFIVTDSNGQEYFLHKMILACHSDYFQAMFDSQFRESQVQRSQLSFPDPQRVLSQIFQYMYTYQLSIQPETIVPLLHQAEYYQISELIDSLKKEVREVYLPKFVLQILRDSVRYKMPEMIELSSGVLAENFDAVEWDLYGEDLNFLPVDVLQNVLTHRALTLDTEYRVYKVISNYIQDWKKKPKVIRALEDEREILTSEHCHELYTLIYFEQLTLEQLEEANQNENVPRDLLCQGLLTALRMALGKSDGEERGTQGRLYTNAMGMKRGRDFCYTSDFDQNGVVYWLGTQLDDKVFVNPHESGQLICFMSGIQVGKPSNLTSRQNQPTCTQSQHEAYLGIDLGPSNFVLKPTHYTLKHGYYKDNVNLRRWQFEGSLDGNSWETLSVHDSEMGLGGEYGSKTFSVQSEKWFRLFRVKTIGKFFIQICGMELYGNLLPKTLDAVFKRLEKPTIKKDDSLDFLLDEK